MRQSWSYGLICCLMVKMVCVGICTIELKEFELASYVVRGKVLWFWFALLCCCVYDFGFLIK